MRPETAKESPSPGEGLSDVESKRSGEHRQQPAPPAEQAPAQIRLLAAAIAAVARTQQELWTLHKDAAAAPLTAALMLAALNHIDHARRELQRQSSYLETRLP